MAADNTLFTREDGLDRAWEIVTPVPNGLDQGLSAYQPGLGPCGG